MPEQRIVPMLAYEDAGAAIDWLFEAFGFEEVADQRHTDGDGTVTHAELRAGESAIFLATPNKDYESPRRHRETCDAAGWVHDKRGCGPTGFGLHGKIIRHTIGL